MDEQTFLALPPGRREAEFKKLPEANRKALQEQWQAKGFYADTIDGKWGSGTAGAIEQAAANRRSDAEIENERIKAQATVATAEAERIRAQAEAQKLANETQEAGESRERREAMRDWRSSPEGAAYELALGFGGPAAGVAAGHAFGHGTSNLLDAYDASRAGALSEAAREASQVNIGEVATNPAARARAAGAVSAARPYMPANGPTLSGALGTAGRAASYFGPAAAFVGEGLYLRDTANPSDDENFRLKDDVQYGIGSTLVGTGAGAGVEGVRRLSMPTTPHGYAGDVATVRQYEEAIRQADATGTPPPNAPPNQPPDQPDGPRPHSRRLSEAVRAAGGPANLSKADAEQWLRSNVTAQNRGPIAKALNVRPGKNFAARISRRIGELAGSRGAMAVAPLVAGAVAYDAASGDAEASEGGEGTAMSPAVAAGTAAGGTAGAMYGVNRLAQMPAVQAAGRVAGPVGWGMLGYDLARDTVPYPTQTPASEAEGMALDLSMRAGINPQELPRNEDGSLDVETLAELLTAMGAQTVPQGMMREARPYLQQAPSIPQQGPIDPRAAAAMLMVP